MFRVDTTRDMRLLSKSLATQHCEFAAWQLLQKLACAISIQVTHVCAVILASHIIRSELRVYTYVYWTVYALDKNVFHRFVP